MRRSITLAFFCSALAACHPGHADGVVSVPVFHESERNDDPLTANRFGLLRPGDHFFIDGFVRDDLVDPFDGFAFTAAQPLHVDFQLFIGNAMADLDVCLYDPALDQTVACFATSDDPERGGVDVFDGGVDFQLVVESFVGDASYSLEIAVQPLFLAATAEAGDGARAPRLAGLEARELHEAKAEAGYRAQKPATPRLVIEQILDLDEASGLVIERVRVLGPGL